MIKYRYYCAGVFRYSQILRYSFNRVVVDLVNAIIAMLISNLVVSSFTHAQEEEAFGSAPQLFSPISMSGGTAGNETVSDVEAGLTTDDDDGERGGGAVSSSKPLLLNSPVTSSTASSAATNAEVSSLSVGVGRRRRLRVLSTSGETTSMRMGEPTTSAVGEFSSVDEASDLATSTVIDSSSSSRRMGSSQRQVC